MAGILDKKSRFIDYKLSVDGRSQLENNDIRIVFASFSDRSILYEKDYNLSKEVKFDISSTQNYLPLETSPKNYFEINKELDLEKLYKTRLNETFSFESFESSKSLAENLASLSLITNRRRIRSNSFTLSNTGFLRNVFDFSTYFREGATNVYPTIKANSVLVKSLPTIAFDKRFSHKNNTKQLIPIGANNQKIYDEEDFSSFEKRLVQNKGGLGFLIDKINSFITINDASDREQSIIEALRQIDNIRQIERNVFELTEYPENLDVLFEMFEVKTNGSEEKLSELHFINLGEVYSSFTKSFKQVYLIGKIINSRSNGEENKDLNALYTFNSGEISSSSNIEIALTSYFSFVSTFILVVE